MGNPYTSQSVGSTFNANPPPDDGTQSEANRVKYSTIKAKLADPLKTFVDSVNSAVSTAFGKVPGGGGVTSVSSNYTVQTGDQGNTIVASGSITITTPSAATVGNPFMFDIVNDGIGDVTVAGSGSETINRRSTFGIPPGGSARFQTDGTNWFASGGSAAGVGDVTTTARTTAPAGWLFYNGDSIGNADSGADQASDDYEDLFKLLWGAFADSEAAVSSGRGLTAQADWDADKTLTMPDPLGRAIIGSGTGSGLTARTHGDTGGAEDVATTVLQTANHEHTIPATTTGGGSADTNNLTFPLTGGQAGTFENMQLVGGDQAHNNMMTWHALNFIIKY